MEDKNNLTEAQILDETLSPEEKSEKGFYANTVCGVCGNICCASCTANGNPSQCAQTRFQNCNVCGHASSAHHPG